MKRFIFIAGILFPVFFLSACNNSLENNNERPVMEFKSKMEINSEKMNVSANIFRDKVGNMQIEFTSPETLAGLKINYSDSESSVEKDDLLYKTNELVFPSFSDVTSVLEAISYVAENADESPFYKDTKEMAFIGKISSGKFELRADRKTGLISEIKIGEKTTVKFCDQEKL